MDNSCAESCPCQCHNLNPNENRLPSIVSGAPAPPPLPLNFPSTPLLSRKNPNGISLADQLAAKSNKIPRNSDSDLKIPPNSPIWTQNQIRNRLTILENSLEKVHKWLPVPPGSKLKSLTWTKLSAQQVADFGSNSLWAKVSAISRKQQLIGLLNFGQLEDLFGAPGGQSPSGTLERRRSAVDLVNSFPSSSGNCGLNLKRVHLLESKRSLNVNIFLRQFKGGPDLLLDQIKFCDKRDLCLEQLRSLKKILPMDFEIEMLNNFDDDVETLANAEQFLFHLIKIENYESHINFMLIKDELKSIVESANPSLEAMIKSANAIKNNRNLQELLFLMLAVGNFLNFGGYNGMAAGFRLNSLLKFSETRSNKSELSLMHFLIQQIEEIDPGLLGISDEFDELEDAMSTSLDQIQQEIDQMRKKIHRLENNFVKNDDFLRPKINEFLEISKNQLEEVTVKLETVNKLQLELAEFLCEDRDLFKLEKLFQIIKSFIYSFKKAVQENTDRRTKAENSEFRKQKRNSLAADELFRKHSTPTLVQRSRADDDTKSLCNILTNTFSTRKSIDSPFIGRKFRSTSEKTIFRFGSNSNTVGSSDDLDTLLDNEMINRRKPLLKDSPSVKDVIRKFETSPSSSFSGEGEARKPSLRPIPSTIKEEEDEITVWQSDDSASLRDSGIETEGVIDINTKTLPIKKEPLSLSAGAGLGSPSQISRSSISGQSSGRDEGFYETDGSVLTIVGKGDAEKEIKEVKSTSKNEPRNKKDEKISAKTPIKSASTKTSSSKSPILSKNRILSSAKVFPIKKDIEILGKPKSPSAPKPPSKTIPKTFRKNSNEKPVPQKKEAKNEVKVIKDKRWERLWSPAPPAKIRNMKTGSFQSSYSSPSKERNSNPPKSLSVAPLKEKKTTPITQKSLAPLNKNLVNGAKAAKSPVKAQPLVRPQFSQQKSIKSITIGCKKPQNAPSKTEKPAQRPWK